MARVVEDCQEPSIPCVATCMGVEMRGEKADKGDELYHRTSVETLEHLEDSGEIKTSEKTGVISLSSNPCHYVGGVVRLVLEADELDTEAVCYIPIDEQEKLDEAIDRYFEENNLSLRLSNQNRAHAACAASPVMYKKECEHMSHDDVPLGKLKRVEYWVSGMGVSCKQQFPAYVERSDIHGRHYRDDVEEMEKVKDFAENQNVPFKVKSCFKWMKTRCSEVKEDGSPHRNCGIRLDGENLERMSRLENPEVDRDTQRMLTLFPEMKEVHGREKSERFCRC